MSNTIWWVYRRSDGEYAGNGVTHYDTPMHASTTVPVCDHDEENGPLPRFDANTETWSIPE